MDEHKDPEDDVGSRILRVGTVDREEEEGRDETGGERNECATESQGLEDGVEGGKLEDTTYGPPDGHADPHESRV